MSKTRRLSSCKSNKSYDAVKRLWGDVEVIDSDKSLRVFVQPEDVESAQKKDPGCCVFAQACKRQFHATKVLFWKSIAYVELPGPDGKRRVERFALSREMRELIESFDRGEHVPLSAGFELRPPTGSHRLDAQSERNRAWKKKHKQALLSGVCVGNRRLTNDPKRGAQGEGAYSRPAIVVDLEVRSGSGRVQFKKTAC
jgi:hypothetical protein